jgi:hypothetical protein
VSGDTRVVDWGTLAAALAGTGLGGALTLLQQAFAGRQRRRDARDMKGEAAAADVRTVLKGFVVTFRGLQEHYGDSYGLDTADPYYTAQLNEMEDHTALISDPALRVRLGEVRLALGLVEPAARRLRSGEPFAEIGLRIAEEGAELVASYLRGDRLPKRSELFVRSHKSAVQVEEAHERQRQEYARKRQTQYRAATLETEHWREDPGSVDPFSA